MGESDRGNTLIRLKGRHVLIVEDDYFIADDLSQGLARHGIERLGPVPSLAKALALIADRKIDAALLDINLNGEMVYTVVDALIARNVPVVFLTGYDADAIPERFAHVPLCQKPVDVDVVLEILSRTIAA